MPSMLQNAKQIQINIPCQDYMRTIIIKCAPNARHALERLHDRNVGDVSPT